MMASARKQPSKPAATDLMAPLGRRLPGERRDDPAVVLALADLLRDENNEVVLFNDSGLRSVALATRCTVVEQGEAPRHVTAAGEDVTGFRYLVFDDGLKLYFQPGVDVVVVSEGASS